MIELIKQINDDVKNIFDKKLETSSAYVVPSRDDQGLTFTVGEEKKGKLIETCVLFIDMRNSTQISNAFRSNKSQLGKLYSAFIHSMTMIADEFGFVRNIVGDRVMVVFDPATCFTDAINCAALMNTAASRILRKHSGLSSFRTGIGIDYGEMLVLKTGIPKKYKEQSEYKGLVWVGNTANVASKLTDIAGKEFTSTAYRITYSALVSTPIIPPLSSPRPRTALDVLLSFDLPQPSPPFGIRRENKTELISQDEFNRNVSINGNKILYRGLDVVNIVPEQQTESTASVLMSSKVYLEFRKENPKSVFLPLLSSRSYRNSPISPVYGGYLLNTDINKIFPPI